MTLGQWLPNRARWLIIPSTLGNGLGALLAAQYVAATFTFPQGALGTFWILVAVIGTAGVGVAEALSARHLRTFRGLCAGSLPTSDENRLRALDEVRQFPEHIGRLGVRSWLGAVVALALSFWLVADAPASLVVRIVVMGALFGPMAAVVVGLLVGQRAHEAVERLAEGMSPEDIVSSLRVPRVSVRSRLVLFTLVMVALPSLVVIDVTRALGADTVETWLSAPEEGREAAVAAAQRLVVLKTGLLIAFATAMATLAAALGGSLVTGPLQRIADDASSLASGRLVRAQLIAGDGEVWLISNVFSRLEERLVSMVGRLASATRRLAKAASSLRRASEDSESGAADQAAALNQTSATTEELAQSARQIASSAGSVQELSRKTLEAADSGLASAEAFRAAIERMRQDNRSIAAAVDRLTGRVQQIGRIVDVINTVADRSDLLALSAELEGTRAGEVGRGFSLVASEMRRLAENVLESTAEVEELITEIRTATRQTSDATERARALTESSTALADEVARALTSVAQSARQTSDAVRTISLATQQQQTGTDQLAEAMADILGITQQSLATTRQLTAANERLQRLSSVLAEVVSRFQRQDA
ncbi:MAG: methyl-accepting chemotaxis protein [Myxococcus sp.]|nr:methyl-accepting chemotaxis protein [Myxococcus sp.]